MYKFVRVGLPVLTLGALLGALALLPGSASAEMPQGAESGQGTLQQTMDFGGVTVYYAVQDFNAIPDGFLDWNVRVQGAGFAVGVAVQQYNSQTGQWENVAEAGDLQATTAQVTFPENDVRTRFIFVGARPGRYTWQAWQ